MPIAVCMAPDVSVPLMMLGWHLSRQRKKTMFVQLCLLAFFGMALLRFGLQIYYIRTSIEIGEFISGMLTNNIYTVGRRLIPGIFTF